LNIVIVVYDIIYSCTLITSFRKLYSLRLSSDLVLLFTFSKLWQICINDLTQILSIRKSYPKTIWLCIYVYCISVSNKMFLKFLKLSLLCPCYSSNCPHQS